MDRHRRLLAVSAAASLMAFALAGAKAEDAYPSKPIRIVVSFAAGGPTDHAVENRPYGVLRGLANLVASLAFDENGFTRGSVLGARRGRR